MINVTNTIQPNPMKKSQKNRLNDQIPQANPIFLRLMFALGRPFRWYFKLECRKNEETLSSLVAQETPFIVVFNHSSHLDTLAVSLCLGSKLIERVNLPGKKELFHDWRFSWFTRLAGAIPLDRDVADVNAVRKILLVLKSGRGIILAPEGTRSLDGEVQPFKSGFVKLAYKANAKILPVGINGAFEALPKSAPLPKHHKLTVTVGELLDPRVSLPEKATSQDIDQYAEMVRQRVIDLAR